MHRLGNLEKTNSARVGGHESATCVQGTRRSRQRDEVMEDRVMRKAGWILLASVLLSTGTGCLIPIYSGDPIRRAQQLIYTSEDLRAITDEWERIWFLDQPSHMTPWRTHGGIL